MEIPAKITSKGQITIPATVRKAMGLEAGDRVVFRLEDGRALFQAEKAGEEGALSVELEKVPDFFDLAGSVPVPADVDPADWPAQREAAWAAAVRDRA
jgi:antitoxin PrlF